MSDRDAYVEKMKAKLDEWNAEVSKLEARSRGAQADMRQQFEKNLEELRRRRDEAEQQLREMQQASEESWKHFRSGMEKAWDDVNKAFRDAMESFR